MTRADRAFEAGRGLEVTAMRLRRELHPAPVARPSATAVSADEQTAMIVLDVGDPSPTAVRTLDRGALGKEPMIGPARIDEQTSTLWLPPGARLVRRADGALEIDPGSPAER